MSLQRQRQPLFTFSDALHSQRIGMHIENAFKPVWVSQTPYELTAGQWRMAWLTAQSLGHLFASVSRHRDWLNKVFRHERSTTLATQLLRRLPDTVNHDNNVFLSRHDLMLDHNQNWKLIESNAIAAGMGPFSDDLSAILAAQSSCSFAPNGAIQRQGRALYEAARQNRGVPDPVIVFVVEPHECNRFDQQKLAAEITRNGGQVIYRTLADLANEKQHAAGKCLCLRTAGVIDLLYFRTGYNLSDYQDDDGRTESLLDLRASLEVLQVKHCPSIAGQLASHKAMQRAVSGLSVSTLMSEFHLPVQHAILANLALSVKYSDVDVHLTDQHLRTGDWLLKSTEEGGGNVYAAAAQVPADHKFNNLFLMQRIHPSIRQEPVTLACGNEARVVNEGVSELGLFTLGSDHDYGGYLLRTKAKESLECGVRKGYGAIDTVIVKSS